MKYSVHDMQQLAVALMRASGAAIGKDIEEVEANNTFDAIEKVLDHHPIPVAIGWAKKCLHDLQTGRP